MFRMMLLVLVAALVIGCGEDKPELSEIRRMTVPEVYSNYHYVKGETVMVSGFAVMSAFEFWVLEGKGTTAFTPLGDSGSSSNVVHLWWEDWTGSGFERSGDLTAICKVGSFAPSRDWIHYTNEVRMEDCVLPSSY